MRDVRLRLGISEGTFTRRSWMVRFLTVITNAYTTGRERPSAQNFSDVSRKPFVRVHLDGKGLEMRQDALDGLVAPGPAPLGRQRLPEVLLKGARQAGRPGQSLLRALLAWQRAQKQAQVAVLHLWRRRPGR